jgi:DNA-binding NtrC family response regulator
MTSILFVDDDRSVLHGLERAMRSEDHEILTAGSGADALEILGRRAVDVVVSDERMPGMSGSELLKAVRDRFPETLRIMLTGHASVESAMNAIYDGWVFQYLHKPVQAADLVAVIHHGLKLKSLLKEGEGPHVTMPGDAQEELLRRVASKEHECERVDGDPELVTAEAVLAEIRSLMERAPDSEADELLVRIQRLVASFFGRRAGG